jgi:hypothetical protein
MTWDWGVATIEEVITIGEQVGGAEAAEDVRVGHDQEDHLEDVPSAMFRSTPPRGGRRFWNKGARRWRCLASG